MFSLSRTKASFDIAKYLVEKYHAKTIGQKRDREIYIYKDGIYELGINVLRGEIQQMLEELATTQVKNETVEKVKDLTVTDRREFIVDKNFINLNNGILNIERKELIDHNPKYLFFHKVNVDYKPQADRLSNKKVFIRGFKCRGRSCNSRVVWLHLI